MESPSKSSSTPEKNKKVKWQVDLLRGKPHTDPKQRRMCIDYRRLNALTEAESWPLPYTEHMFERIGAKRAKFFAVMDFTQGFHQVEVHPLFRHLIAFITFCGIFKYKRVPFGPKNGPSYFQQSLAYVVLAGLLYIICEIYVDDLIVNGVDEETSLKISALYLNI